MISLLSFGTGLKFTNKGFCGIWDKYNYSVQRGSKGTIDGMSVTTKSFYDQQDNDSKYIKWQMFGGCLPAFSIATQCDLQPL